METYATDNNAYTGTVTDLTNIESTLNSAVGAANENLLVATPAAGIYGAALAGGESNTNSYQITLTSKSGVLYAITRRSDGVVDRTCNVPAGVNAGGCKTTAGTTGNGTW